MGGFRSFQYKKLFVLRTIITKGNEEEREIDPLEHSKLIKLAKRAVPIPVYLWRNIIFILDWDLELHGSRENFTTI